mmetsp:Transcript_124587/g.387939  ORF Transcript_124587/g.387939 Transcript_124587/m.387939 type:complete len:216 (-) Transcript_124587:54-701(-)
MVRSGGGHRGGHGQLQGCWALGGDGGPGLGHIGRLRSSRLTVLCGVVCRGQHAGQRLHFGVGRFRTFLGHTVVGHMAALLAVCAGLGEALGPRPEPLVRRACFPLRHRRDGRRCGAPAVRRGVPRDGRPLLAPDRRGHGGRPRGLRLVCRADGAWASAASTTARSAIAGDARPRRSEGAWGGGCQRGRGVSIPTGAVEEKAWRRGQTCLEAPSHA